MNVQKILMEFDPSSSREVSRKLIIKYLQCSVYFSGFGNV